MSMPEFPSSETFLTREQALHAMLASITMEESALSQIINAQSEIIQYASDCVRCDGSDADMQKFAEVNANVSALLEQVNDMQSTLQNKMHFTVSCMPPQPEPCHPGSPPCQDRCNQPCPPPRTKLSRRPGHQLILARGFFQR